MKKETGIILLVVGLIVGFGAGLITSTAMRPSGGANSAAQATQLPSASAQSPGAVAASQQADKQAAERARIMEKIKSLKYALEKDPDNLDIHIALGNSYFDIGQHNTSIEHYEKALKISPENADVLVDLGIMYRRTDRAKIALEKFEEAITIKGTHENAYLNRAVVLRYDLGDYEKALSAFKEFLKIAPSGHPMLQNVNGEIEFLSAAIKGGNLGPAFGGEEESHEGHNHPPGEGH